MIQEKANLSNNLKISPFYNYYLEVFIARMNEIFMNFNYLNSIAQLKLANPPIFKLSIDFDKELNDKTYQRHYFDVINT